MSWDSTGHIALCGRAGGAALVDQTHAHHRSVVQQQTKVVLATATHGAELLAQARAGRVLVFTLRFPLSTALVSGGRAIHGARAGVGRLGLLQACHEAVEAEFSRASRLHVHRHGVARHAARLSASRVPSRLLVGAAHQGSAAREQVGQEARYVAANSTRVLHAWLGTHLHQREGIVVAATLDLHGREDEVAILFHDIKVLATQRPSDPVIELVVEVAAQPFQVPVLIQDLAQVFGQAREVVNVSVLGEGHHVGAVAHVTAVSTHATRSRAGVSRRLC